MTVTIPLTVLYMIFGIITGVIGGWFAPFVHFKIKEINRNYDETVEA